MLRKIELSCDRKACYGTGIGRLDVLFLSCQEHCQYILPGNRVRTRTIPGGFGSQ